MMTPRTIDRTEQPERRRTTRCITCSKATRGDKDRCVDHVEERPYVIDLLSRIATKAKEEESVAQRGPKAVDITGITSKEILTYLRAYGRNTLKRIAKDLSLPLHITASYIVTLDRARLVITTRNSRNGLVIGLA